MVKRLLRGLFKGLLIGGAIGAGLQVGLGWGSVGWLLGILVAMGTGATTGVACGKPPWRAGVWVEALLKGLAGVAVGALLYWLATRYAGFAFPFELPAAAAGRPWTGQPLLFAPALAMLFGALVELDNTGEDDGHEAGGGKRGRGRAARARVAVGDAVGEEPPARSAARGDEAKG